MDTALSHLDKEILEAVAFFWRTRLGQAAKQTKSGEVDQGFRGAVTGGKQMDGFVKLLCKLAHNAEVDNICIHCEKTIQLPGFFRPSKQWDFLIVSEKRLLAVVELKSQVGPSFGNNFNNRVEEAIGSAVDLWTAYREGAFSGPLRPWLGYLFLLEDCPKSRSPVRVEEPHFKVFPEFIGASYMKRYELFCRKLVRERHYETAAFITSPVMTTEQATYDEPANDLTLRAFAASFVAAMKANAMVKK